jgi:hypothetical protein
MAVATNTTRLLIRSAGSSIYTSVQFEEEEEEEEEEAENP